MRVQEIMTRDVFCCNPSTNAAVAAELMWTRNCGALPVVENGGRVIGMVTDRDLFIALGTSNRKASNLTIGEIMSRDLAFCAPGDDVQTALRTMGQRQIQRLPVVDKTGLLKGVLSVDDIALRAEADGLPSDQVLGTLKAIWGRQIQRKAGELTTARSRAAVA